MLDAEISLIDSYRTKLLELWDEFGNVLQGEDQEVLRKLCHRMLDIKNVRLFSFEACDLDLLSKEYEDLYETHRIRTCLAVSRSLLNLSRTVQDIAEEQSQPLEKITENDLWRVHDLAKIYGVTLPTELVARYVLS